MKPLFYDWPEGTLYFGSALMKSDAHAHSTHSMSEIRRLKINVFLAGRGQLVGFLVLSILASCYARAADVPVRQDDKERQEFLVHKVNAVQVVDDTFRFGAKIESERHLHHSFNSNFTGARVPASRSTSATKRPRYRNANSQTETAVTSENGSSAKVPSIARRFELQKEPVASVARYDGMVQKDCASLHRTQQRSGDDFRHRTERGRSVIPQPSNHPSGASLQIRLEEAASELTADISQTEQQADQSVGSSASVRYTTPSSKSGRSNITFATTEHRRTTRIPRSEFLRDSSLNTPFGFIARNLWSLSGPSSAPQSPSPQTAKSTRKPPKKYKLATSTSSENKPRFQKSKSIAASEQPNTAVIHKDDGPFRIALPTISFPSPSSTLGGQESKNEKEKRATVMALRGRFKCPRESEVRFQLFPKICKMDKDCSVWNRDELCCEIFGAKSCVTGVPKPLEESSHTPFLGLIPRKCPTRPLAELWWDVKECDTDTDCWPRVCCPDGRRRYCRTSEPELEIVPVPVPVKRSFNYLTEYLECTPPPPPIFDLHPKACTSTFDCFPNVCCQEAGLRHCRPPKKSVLTLMANFLNVGFVKRLTQNIVIK